MTAIKASSFGDQYLMVQQSLETDPKTKGQVQFVDDTSMSVDVPTTQQQNPKQKLLEKQLDSFQEFFTICTGAQWTDAFRRREGKAPIAQDRILRALSHYEYSSLIIDGRQLLQNAETLYRNTTSSNSSQFACLIEIVKQTCTYLKNEIKALDQPVTTSTAALSGSSSSIGSASSSAISST